MTRKSQKDEASKGRPKGAGNIDRPTAVAIPARCPACRDTKYQCMRGAVPVVHQIDGVSRLTGESYSFVVWHNVICCGCGQHYRIREETNHDPRLEE